MGAYVYYSYEEFGRGYIGARNRDPVGDNYLGSYTDQTFNPTEKVVIAEFDTFEEALDTEYSLHCFFQVGKNPHFANKQIGGMGSNWSDPTSVWADYTEKERRQRIEKAKAAIRPEVRRAAAFQCWEQEDYRDKVVAATRAFYENWSEEERKEHGRKSAAAQRKSWKKEWWDAVVQAGEYAKENGHKRWFLGVIQKKYNVGRKPLVRIKKLIQEGYTWEEAVEGRG